MRSLSHLLLSAIVGCKYPWTIQKYIFMCDCVSIQLGLPKQTMDWIWPRGCNCQPLAYWFNLWYLPLGPNISAKMLFSHVGASHPWKMKVGNESQGPRVDSDGWLVCGVTQPFCITHCMSLPKAQVWSKRRPRDTLAGEERIVNAVTKHLRAEWVHMIHWAP